MVGWPWPVSKPAPRCWLTPLQWYWGENQKGRSEEKLCEKQRWLWCCASIAEWQLKVWFIISTAAVAYIKAPFRLLWRKFTSLQYTLYILSLKVSKFCYFTAHRVSGEYLFFKELNACFNPSSELNVPGSEAFAVRGWFQQRHLNVPLPQCSWAVRLFHTAFLKWPSCSSLTSCPLKPDSILLPSCLQGISSGVVKRPRWYWSVELAVVQKA